MMEINKQTAQQIAYWLRQQQDVEESILQRLLEDARQGVRAAAQQFQKRKKREAAERVRIASLHAYERLQRKAGFQYIAGVDEAGRGPLAGPVVAAAVILPADIYIPHINDSKKLSPGQRDALYDVICEKALCYGVGFADHIQIDRVNILQATYLAMAEAVAQLNPKPQVLLNDAVVIPHIQGMEQIPIIKGDARSISIAAASILAKVTRDRLMDEADKLYPQYGFAKHKGYFTPEHQEALKQFGPSPIHRRSFAPVTEVEEGYYAG